MREEIHTNTPIVTSCTCPKNKHVSTEISDIEEFGMKGVSSISSSNNSKGMEAAGVRKRGTNPKLISLRRSGTSLDSMNIVDTVALCTCQQSQSYPFCDNTHTTFNKETNSKLSPIIVAFLEDSNTISPSNITPTTTSITSTIHDNNTITGALTPNVSDFTQKSTEQSFVDNISENLYSKSAIQDPQSSPCKNTSVTSPRQPPPPKFKPSSIKDKTNQLNIFTEEEIAEHCTKDSLWMIIKDNVYDITAYVSSHPGGERALLKFAGRDGTENVEYHSPKMLQILNSTYFIGKLYKEKQESSCTIS